MPAIREAPLAIRCRTLYPSPCTPSRQTLRYSRGRRTLRGTSARAGPPWSGRATGGILLQHLRITLDIRGDQMVGDDVRQEVEPEQRYLAQHTSLMRDAGGEHVIEGGNAVRGDEEQPVSVELVNVAYLTAGVKLEVGKVCL